MVYLISSLRCKTGDGPNTRLYEIAATLRAAGHEVFSSWQAAGFLADDHWREYEQARGLTFTQALRDYAAQHVFQFDKLHLERADTVVLVLPAGKSGHLELGWALGQGKKGYILLEGEPERWDVMYAFADGVFTDVKELVKELESKVPHWVNVHTGEKGTCSLPRAGHTVVPVDYDFHAGEQ